jgi:hypothetical protein
MVAKLQVFPVSIIMHKYNMSSSDGHQTLAVVRICDGQREDPEECYQGKQATLEPS